MGVEACVARPHRWVNPVKLSWSMVSDHATLCVEHVDNVLSQAVQMCTAGNSSSWGCLLLPLWPELLKLPGRCDQEHHVKVTAGHQPPCPGAFKICGTAQHSTAQHSTAQHSTAQHSTAPKCKLCICSTGHVVCFLQMGFDSFG
jgi:hypothetical protein